MLLTVTLPTIRTRLQTVHSVTERQTTKAFFTFKMSYSKITKCSSIYAIIKVRPSLRRFSHSSEILNSTECRFSQNSQIFNSTECRFSQNLQMLNSTVRRFSQNSQMLNSTVFIFSQNSQMLNSNECRFS